MLVNNINISTFNATYLLKDIQTAEVIIYDEWLRNALTPLYLGKQEKYKQIKLQLLIKGADDESCLIDISNLIQQFEKCTIKFDDLNFYYDCTIVNKSNTRITKGVYTLDIELKAPCAYLPVVNVVMHTGTTPSLIIAPQGNLETPVILDIGTNIPILESDPLIISGFEDVITIYRLGAGMNDELFIDGKDGTVINNNLNAYSDVDMWSFPSLKPGNNTITVNKPGITILFSYNPRFR